MFSLLFFFIFLLSKEIKVIANNSLFNSKNEFKSYGLTSKGNKNSINIFNDIRIAIKDINKKWLDRRIPFLISNKFSAQNTTLIEEAIHGFQNTCIKFDPKREKDLDFIVIMDGDGCNSPVGKQGGPQNVSLGKGCLNYNTIIHELMHSIGFYHEHQRYDRDDHIIIHSENIKRGMEFEFTKRAKNETIDVDFNYDYNSVMQYEEIAFSRNGRPTMESKVKGIKLGPIKGLSPTDILRINKYYGCRAQDLENEEIVNTFDPNSICLDLKWKKFDPKSGQILVFGGNDSFGNSFYICRALINNQMIGGHLFEGMCYVVENESELRVEDFQVLTHSKNGYKWQNLSYNRLPLNAIIIIKGSNDSIGRCSLKYLNYRTQVIGTIHSVNQISVPFNGIEIKCNEFQVLLCRTSK